MQFLPFKGLLWLPTKASSVREAALHICAPAKHRQEAGARKGARKGAKELPSSPQGRGFSQTPQKAGAPSSSAASALGPQAPSGPPGDPEVAPQVNPQVSDRLDEVEKMLHKMMGMMMGMQHPITPMQQGWRPMGL